jgi:hypothetical protein
LLRRGGGVTFGFEGCWRCCCCCWPTFIGDEATLVGEVRCCWPFARGGTAPAAVRVDDIIIVLPVRKMTVYYCWCLIC